MAFVSLNNISVFCNHEKINFAMVLFLIVSSIKEINFSKSIANRYFEQIDVFPGSSFWGAHNVNGQPDREKGKSNNGHYALLPSA